MWVGHHILKALNIMFITKIDTTQLGKRLPQDFLIQYQAWLNATGFCLRENIDDQAQVDQIFKETYDLYKSFSVPNTIVAYRHIKIMEGLEFTPGMDPSSSPILKKLLDNYLKTGEPPSMSSRSSIVVELTRDLMSKFYSNVPQPPKQIVLVSSSSPNIPSGAQIFISENKWVNTGIIHSYFMGCYGAIPALKIAVGQLLGTMHQLLPPKDEVDIIHAEFFSCYGNLMMKDLSNIINQTLFSDGMIKYSISKEKTHGLEILYMDETIIANSSELMKWFPDVYGFEVFLSKSIPEQFASAIHNFVIKLFSALKLDFNELKNKLIYAIHPGGSKILEGVANELNLSDEQMYISKNTLYNHGNASSATLPIMWKTIIDDPSIQTGTYILSLAFGPGLTIIGCILKKQ